MKTCEALGAVAGPQDALVGFPARLAFESLRSGRKGRAWFRG